MMGLAEALCPGPGRGWAGATTHRAVLGDDCRGLAAAQSQVCSLSAGGGGGGDAEQAETIAVHYLIPTRFRQGPAEASANSAFFKTP